MLKASYRKLMLLSGLQGKVSWLEGQSYITRGTRLLPANQPWEVQAAWSRGWEKLLVSNSWQEWSRHQKVVHELQEHYLTSLMATSVPSWPDSMERKRCLPMCLSIHDGAPRPWYLWPKTVLYLLSYFAKTHLKSTSSIQAEANMPLQICAQCCH